jgi:hypothetical protein
LNSALPTQGATVGSDASPMPLAGLSAGADNRFREIRDSDDVCLSLPNQQKSGSASYVD